MEEFHRAVEEEKCLRDALQLCTESGREMHVRLKKETNELAVKRLEAALFNDDDDDDDDDNLGDTSESEIDCD